MSDYVLIQEKTDGLGQISVSHNVINDIVKNVISKDKDVFLEETRSLKGAPLVKADNNSIRILLKVRVRYGKDVEAVCKNLQKELKQQLQLMVGYHNTVVDFDIVGFRFN